ncbi:unnamed protein product [Calicophoron daubneyi]|uniref:PH domain-containing protein n=1 Tax=Calicophoron daubneyi TaxID=300641 RepID=A0AAV2T925_CALDB
MAHTDEFLVERFSRNGFAANHKTNESSRFLDIQLTRNLDGSVGTPVHSRAAWNCQKIQLHSFTPIQYKLGNFGGSSRERKEAVRQVFLFTNHLLITARTNNGRLRLVKNYGKIALVECTLVEDTNADLFSMEDENTPNVEQTLTHPERKISDHISAGSRVCGSITPGYGTITSSLGIHNRSSVVVPPVLTEIGLAMKTSVRADSGPPSAGYVNRRFQSYDVSPRLSSASTSAAMMNQGSSGLSAPTGGMRSPTTNAALHRHSTSLCMSATDPENNNSTNGVSSRSSARPSLNTSHFLSGNGAGGGGTEVTALNVTAASGVAGPVNQPSTPGASVPFSHRFSSNFGVFTGSVGANGMDKTDYGSLDFRLIWEPKNGPPTSIWLVASTLQEKAAWCSDISQCIEQLHYGDILNSAQTDVSSVAMPQSIR